jgi:hypothetical protein
VNMSGQEAKFCLDRNQVRWVLIEGVINRKTQQDDPAGGMNLPVEKIQRIEKKVVTRQHKSPLAAPITIAGIVLMALSGLIAVSSLWMGVPGLVVGSILIIWGLMRISPAVERIDAFQIVAPGTTPQEWLVVGSHHEVVGFLEGLERELAKSQRNQAALRN